MPKIEAYNVPKVDGGGELKNFASNEYPDVAYTSQVNQGRAISEFGDQIVKRQTQVELSDANAQMAKAQSDWQVRLQQQTQDGSINTEQVKQDYADYMQKLGGQYHTPEAKAFFSRESAQLGTSILGSAMKSQAVIAGARAEDNLMTATNHDATSLRTDPSTFDLILSRNQAAIDAEVKNGSLSAVDALKIKEASSKELAQAAMKGWAELNPEFAKKKLAEGTYDKYIDDATRSQLETYIKVNENAKDSESARRDAAITRAQKLQDESWQQSAIPLLTKQALTTNMVIQSNALPETKLRYLRLIKESAKEGVVSNPAMINELTRNALLPDDDPNKRIRNMGDLAPYVGKDININDAEKIVKFTKTLPQEEAIQDNRKRLVKYATAELVKSNSFAGPDPKGEYNLSQFVVSLQKQEEQLRKDGKPVSALYDPTNKDYFGNQINKYRRTQQEIFADRANVIRKQNAPPTEAMIQVEAPDGKRYSMPASNKDKALKQNFKIIGGK